MNLACRQPGHALHLHALFHEEEVQRSRQSCPDDFVSVVGFDESGVVEQRSQEEVRQFFVVEFLGVSDFASPSKYVERVPDVVIGVVLYRLEYPQYVAVRFHQ